MVVIGDCTLYLGDCLDVLPLLSPVNHVITDPPFEEEAHTKQRRTNGQKSINGKYHRELTSDPLSFPPITERVRERFSSLAANLASGWLLAFCQAEAVKKWADTFDDAGAKYKRAMIWVKPDGLPQMSGDGPGMGYESMVLAWAGEGKSSWNGGGRHGVFNIPRGSDGEKPVHQTQKPLRLMKEIVSLFSNPNEIILDPFMGSGTTGIACAKMGRKFIGIELDEKYFDIACRRIEEAYRQTDLFIPHQPQEQMALILDNTSPPTEDKP